MEAEWFQKKPALPDRIELTVFKVDGEINTDDFSPALHARPPGRISRFTRSAMGESSFPGGIETIAEFRSQGRQIAFVGDVVGHRASSRKSACNSLIWHIGEDIPYVPNKRRGGVVIGGQIAPIFFNTAEDSGALPIRCDVLETQHRRSNSRISKRGKDHQSNGETLSEFELFPNTIGDEYRAGGRVNYNHWTRYSPTKHACPAVRKKANYSSNLSLSRKEGVGYTLAQKIIGKACGVEGIHPGTACTPLMTTVGSQDTTGPMTADELKELACLKSTPIWS